MDLFRLILERLGHEYPCIVTEAETKQYAKDFKKLAKLGLLTESEPKSERLCPTCKQEFLALQPSKNGRSFTVCNRNESAGRDYVNPVQVQSWTFNLPRLLTEMQKAHGIKATPQELLPGDIWLLNPVASPASKMLFCRSLQPNNHPFLENMKGCTVILPAIAKCAVPRTILTAHLSDIITVITPRGLKVKTSLLLASRRNIGTQGDIELNDEVVLTADGRLIRRGQQLDLFDESPRLPPLAQRILRYLYDIRDHENNSRTLGELAEALSRTKNKRSISNAILQAKTLCKKNQSPCLLSCLGSGRWRLAGRAEKS